MVTFNIASSGTWILLLVSYYPFYSNWELTSVPSRVECSPCDITIVVSTERKIETINIAQIEKFLCTIQEECRSNIEFAEFSNEIVFKLIERRTEAFLKALDRIPQVNRNNVLREISFPIKDYKIEDLIMKVQDTNSSIENKTLVLQALKIASTKM